MTILFDDPRCLWIRRDGRAHRCYYGSHAAVIREQCPRLAAGDLSNSQVNTAAVRDGWLLVTWPANEKAPLIAIVYAEAGAVPRGQWNAWAAWCDEMERPVESLKIILPGSADARLWLQDSGSIGDYFQGKDER